ncbi:MAG TPA: MASE1 domain-containing protein [Xanthomonadaceae bacterium]|nr:MASE1 domain-containing protein [Xanthomonadaceae bacterium]
MNHVPESAPATALRRLPPWVWGVLYALGWLLAFQVSRMYWFVPAGLRVGALLVAPPRVWPWLAVFEFSAILLLLGNRFEIYQTALGFALANFAPWLVQAAVVWVSGLRGRAPDSPGRMAQLVLLFAVAAAATAAVLTVMTLIESRVTPPQVPQTLVQYWIGDVVAMLIVAPVVLAVAAVLQGRAVIVGAVRELLLLLLPLLVFCCALALLYPQLSAYVLVLGLAPMLLIAFRHGWRGAALALLMTSGAVYAIGVFGAFEHGRELMQLIMAVLGATTLMLGAATDSLRLSNEQLDARNRELAAASARQHEQSQALRQLSERLVRVQDDEHSRIARELEDELGHAVSELGARLTLAAREADSPTGLATVDSLREMVRHLNLTIANVLARLGANVQAPPDWSPATITSGPLGELLGEAGVDVEVTVTGPAPTITPAISAALFRICQILAVECVRRGLAERLVIDLRVESGGADPQRWLRLRVFEHVGERHSGRMERLAAEPPSDRVRDRVGSLGGEYLWRFESGALVHDLVVPEQRTAAQD